MTSAVSGKTIFGHYRDIPPSYEALHAFFPLRPLRSVSDYDRAVEVAGSLAGHELNPEQDDYLGTLGALIVAYEDQNRPFEMPQMSGLDALKGLLRDHEMNASDLSRLLGAHRSLGSKILQGERSLTVQHLRILTEYFKVSADLFLPDSSAKDERRSEASS
jgi:HTH-type transcriptional regulator/antitoxin HigA